MQGQAFTDLFKNVSDRLVVVVARDSNHDVRGFDLLDALYKIGTKRRVVIHR
jgi:hypothetical protein